MKNILWYQDPENKSKNVISCNGDIITPPSHPRYAELYDILFKFDKELKNQKSNDSIYCFSKGYFLKGYFEEKDIVGRNIGFMFYCDTKNKEEVIARLQEEAGINGKTCQVSVLDSIYDHRKPISTKTIIIAIAVLSIVSIIVYYLHNNNI